MSLATVRSLIRRDARREQWRRHVASLTGLLVSAVIALGLAALLAALGR